MYINGKKILTVVKGCALDKYAQDIIIDEAAGTLTIKGDLAAHGINKVIVNDDVDINLNDGCNVTITAECDVTVKADCIISVEGNGQVIDKKSGATILGA